MQTVEGFLLGELQKLNIEVATSVDVNGKIIDKPQPKLEMRGGGFYGH